MAHSGAPTLRLQRPLRARCHMEQQRPRALPPRRRAKTRQPRQMSNEGCKRKRAAARTADPACPMKSATLPSCKTTRPTHGTSTAPMIQTDRLLQERPTMLYGLTLMSYPPGRFIMYTSERCMFFMSTDATAAPQILRLWPCPGTSGLNDLVKRNQPLRTLCKINGLQTPSLERVCAILNFPIPHT